MDRESDGKVGGELLDELFSAFEDLETQSAGLLQFLKAKGLATDEELAPYLQQAADASNVRWLAGRLRMDALLAAAIKDAEEEFARKAEGRARAQNESSTEKKEERGESEKKAAAKDPSTGSRNPDARDEESPRQARGTKAGANSEAEEGTDDRKQVAKATNEEVETDAKTEIETDAKTVGVTKGTPEDNGRNDPAESKTDSKAA